MRVGGLIAAMRGTSLWVGVCLLPVCFISWGCDWSDPMQRMYNEPSPALSDPMHYSPDADNADENSGIGTYDDKAMDQDLNLLELQK